MLFLDFYFRGTRCREQTALPETAENRKKVQGLLNRIQKDIAQGTFDYAATFPSSPRITTFAAATATTSAMAPPTSSTAELLQGIVTPLFGEFSVTWRAEMAPQWRRQHRLGVDDIFKKHLQPTFGTRRLSEITKANVLTFRAALAELPGRASPKISASRINKVMCILRQMLNEAAERFQLPAVFRGIKPLKARRPDVHPFSLGEVDQIRSAIRADYRNYATVRFFTGMRTGEINGLKWKYVDMARGLILVRETFSAGVAEENAKNESSIRDLPMLPIVREALEDQFTNRDPDSPYVFTTKGGNPIDANNFANRIWYPLLRYLQLEKRRPYQTRHTTATLMLASGESPEWIAKMMGHKNTEMLFTVYSRFVPNLTRQDGRAITGLLNSRIAGQDTPAPPVTPEQLAAMSPDQLRQALSQFLTSQPTQL